MKEMERTSEKMGMQVKFSYFCFSGFQNFNELKKLADIPITSGQSMKVLIVPPKLSKEELHNLK